MSGVTTWVFPCAAPQHASAESNQENWEMIGRYQVHSKQFLGVSFTGKYILIFHKTDYLKTKIDDDLLKFNKKLLVFCLLGDRLLA